MRLRKRTYSLPEEIVERFERSVAVGTRSGVVARLVNEWLDEQQRVRLRAEIIEGCREMSDVYLEVEKDYHPLEEEVEREHGAA